jgi:hypothetical protein
VGKIAIAASFKQLAIAGDFATLRLDTEVIA